MNIYACGKIKNQNLPFFSSVVSAGMSTFSEGYIEETVDLNKLLIKNPAATFLAIASGNSMNYAGIHDGDILVVDRSLEADNGSMALSNVNEELTIIPVSKDTDKDKIWGVVTHVIHKL